MPASGSAISCASARWATTTANVVAPPTFAVVVAQRAEAQLIADPEAGIDFSRVVHAEERFTHLRPSHAGAALVTVLHVDAVTERAGLAMVTTRCEISAVDGGDLTAGGDHGQAGPLGDRVDVQDGDQGGAGVGRPEVGE